MPSLNPIFILSILIALTVHEWAHGVVATWLGDPTPANQGRLTLNPLAHLDPMGALMFLLVGFGWAKPVPINPGYFRNQKMGVLLTAIAGPISNLLIAIVCYVSLVAFAHMGGGMGVESLLSLQSTGSPAYLFAVQLLATSLFVNLSLMAFNLIPIPPLDGSNVLRAFIPPSLEDRYEDLMRNGPYILLALFLGERLLGLSIFSSWIMAVMDAVLWVLQKIVGG